MFNLLYEVSYSFIAVFFIFFLRESFRNYIFYSLNPNKSTLKQPYIYIDIWSVTFFTLFNVSWGGLLQSHKGRRDTFLTFFLSQLLYLALLLIIYIYLFLNNPEIETFRYNFLHYTCKACYVLFIVNLIPLPPFDASFFYLQNFLQYKPIYFILILFKVILFNLLYLEVINLNWIFYDTFQAILQQL